MKTGLDLALGGGDDEAASRNTKRKSFEDSTRKKISSPTPAAACARVRESESVMSPCSFHGP